MEQEKKPMTPLPCEQEQNIKEIREGLSEVRGENKQILQNQQTLVSELKESFGRLEKILLSEVEQRKDIDQLKKEADLLFQKQRNAEERVMKDVLALSARMAKMELTKAEYDGARIYERVPVIWEYVQQEKGWRRFLPGVLSAIATICTIATFFMAFVLR